MVFFAQTFWGNVLFVVAGAVAALVLLNLWDLVGVRIWRKRHERAIKDAESEIEGLRTQGRLDAKLEAEEICRRAESRLEAREEKLAERESQLQGREVFMNQQLENLSVREASADKQRESLDDDRKSLESEVRAVELSRAEWIEKLSSVARLTESEARDQLMRLAESEGKREAQDLSRRIIERAKQESEEESRRIVSLAIQRYAGDHTSETTTAAVALKGDDIKGRIIGRDGRNIRAFENATGMTVLIDDTPNAVVLSGFDPVRREVARESMERLIADGRIHPARIEEVVERVSSEIEGRVVKLAEEAVSKLGLAPVHDEISKRLGRLYFRLSYSQNVLDHSVEVARLTALMASELGANITDATRAGLLHDIGKALGDEMKGSHAAVGAEFIRRYGENGAVVNAVASHHDEVEHETVLGILVSAADAISAARPGARSEPITSYINRLKSLEQVGTSFAGVERCFAVQAGREVRVFVRPDAVSDESSFALAKDICRKIEDELHYPGQIRVTVIREIRCVEYAK